MRTLGNSPARKGVSSLNSLAMSPEERCLQSAGRGTRNKAHLHMMSAPNEYPYGGHGGVGTHSQPSLHYQRKVDNEYNDHAANRQRERWIKVINNKEGLVDQ